jgi:tRNA(fMet)-specific endonuclease VapC
MNGRYLLDTNIVIACLSNDPDVVGRINDADEFFVSSTVLGEMLYGAYNSTNVDDNIRRINLFLSKAGLLACDGPTSYIYGEMKTELRQKGRPIPDNDIWIAASAKQHLLTLITRDMHFDKVDKLPVIRW